MATILSTPTTMTVMAPGTPALGPLAASMAAGTWAQLTVSNQNSLVGVGNVSGSMIPYCNSMPWNSSAKVIEITAEDHNYGSLRYVRYDDRTNQFVLVTNDVGLGSNVLHGYDLPLSFQEEALSMVVERCTVSRVLVMSDDHDFALLAAEHFKRGGIAAAVVGGDPARSELDDFCALAFAHHQ